jgi:hypothetical protein
MNRPMRSNRSERGAMLVQACIAFVGLVALTTFVVDFGIMWVGRGQAQNSADAGALAGATALAFDNFNDRTTGGPAVQSALKLALGNRVFDHAPSVLTSDVTFPACPDGTNGCIRVDVYRNTARGNPLPVIFGTIVGLTSQSVRATATAEVLAGNTSNCLKPWVIPDKWQENSVPPNNTFDKYQKQGNNISVIPNPDVYVPPTGVNPTGYTVKANLGLELTLKVGNPHNVITPGWFNAVDLPLPPAGGFVPGGSQYRTNISTCTDWPVTIGETLPPENGNMVGPTKQGVGALVALDPNAVYNPSTNEITGSCANANPSCGAISPRVVAIALINPDALQLSTLQTGGKNINLTVVNILGFFINSLSGNGDVTGYLTTYPGLTTGTPSGPGNTTFLYNPVLVR